ncbi:hypothetical protein [Microcella sp.]|uniref:hypothetical protein n=1 Tax=Microcella sp. TaxID=1913979 RepID=UPI003F6EF40B
MRRTVAPFAALLVAALAGCAAPPAVPTLDAVRAERSLTMTSAWLRAAAATEQYIERDWPEAVYPPLEFERWVEQDRALAEVAACMDGILGRTAGSVSEGGIYTVAPRPTKEPTWALPVAQLRCSVQLVPWTGLFPFGGPVEQEWVRHQLTVALPQCVRRWGAELVIPDIDAAVDASIYATSAGGSLRATQSVWLAAELRLVDPATAQQIRAACPDPGRTLVQLGPAEIRPIEFGPSGGGLTGAEETGEGP